jgi:hypothetical protein
MNETITCPRCHRHLNLPEEALGREVRCPSCDHTFTASLDHRRGRPASVMPPPPREQPAPLSFPPEPRDDFPRTGVRPHRGGVLVGLGVLSLVLFCLPPGGAILAGMVLWMAGNDLNEMRYGRMDGAGRVQTRIAHACGVCSIVFTVVYIVIACGLSGMH